MKDDLIVKIWEEQVAQNDKLANIDKTLAVNTAQLAEHIRRTTQLEEAIKPLVRHDHFVIAIAKVLAAGSGIAAVSKLLVAVLTR